LIKVILLEEMTIKYLPHTKTKMGKRELYLSVDAKKYLAIQLTNEKIRIFAGYEDFSTTENIMSFRQAPWIEGQRLMKKHFPLLKKCSQL